MPEPPRSRHSRSRAPNRLALAPAVALVVSVLALGACSETRHHAGPAHRAPDVALQLGAVQVQSTGAPAQLAANDREAILTVLRDWIEQGSIDPIRTGTVPTTFSGLFTPAAAARAAGSDRATLTDDAAPRATGAVAVSAQPVGLTALAGSDGTVVLVSADVDTTLTAATGSGELRVRRAGDVVLTRDPGGWRIFAYDLAVQRTGRAVDTAPAGRTGT